MLRTFSFVVAHSNRKLILFETIDIGKLDLNDDLCDVRLEPDAARRLDVTRKYGSR